MDGFIGLWRLFGVAGAVMLSVLIGMARQANADESLPFCRKPYVTNLAKPLRELPQLRRLPRAGLLPFGPSQLEMLPIRRNRIVVGGGQVGVILSSSKHVRLDWTIHAVLSRVKTRSQRKGLIRHRRWKIRRMEKNKVTRFVFNVGSAQVIYRFDISVKNRSGEFLGHYAEYFRVVKRTVSAGLELNGTIYRPGATLLVRLENRGTADIYYGYELIVERWANQWTLDPSTPDGWPLIGLGLAGGVIGKCERVILPNEPGVYRISKQYSTSPTGQSIPAHARFTIKET